MNQKKSEDEALSKALGAWRVNEALPPRFQERVWSRIEQAETVRTLSFWEQVSAWVNDAFAKPAVAVAYMSVLLIIGLTAGYVKANSQQTKLNGELAGRYVQAIDPYKAQP
ncbi:MAG: hypothetical protein H0X66_16055 [Verrucomicrobia bacterium]|nr:hypothetical protein [Verrucomicrobiota bacterium]